jgi:hypothetical protein
MIHLVLVVRAVWLIYICFCMRDMMFVRGSKDRPSSLSGGLPSLSPMGKVGQLLLIPVSSLAS